MSMFQNTEKQLAYISEFSFWTLVKFGLQRFRWWSLLIVAAMWIALVIVHVVILSNIDKQLPSPSNQKQPADGVATANFVLISILFLGTLLLSFDVRKTFSDIQKDIQKKPQLSQFENPLEIDAKESGIFVKNGSMTLNERPLLVKNQVARQEKVPLREQTEEAIKNAEERALRGLLEGGSFAASASEYAMFTC